MISAIKAMFSRMSAAIKASMPHIYGTIEKAIDRVRAVLPWGLDKPDLLLRPAIIRRHIFAGSILVAVLIFGLGGWASTAEISGALIAQGSLVVDSNIKKVQHPTGGVVGELFAHDGDHVKTGDILIRLDVTVTRANLAIVTKGLTELYARKARLAAERDGADTVAVPAELANHVDDPDVKEAFSSERRLFDLRRQSRLGQKQQLLERIAQLQQQITGLVAQQDAKDKEVGLIEQELQGVRDLWQRNLVQLSRLTSLEREEARLQGERGQLVAQSAEAKGKIAEIQLQILQVDQDLSSDVAKELRETDSKIGEYVERKVTAEDQLKRTDIRSPQDGIVFQSTANTVGGVITAGDPIMLIVPEVRQSSGRGQGRSQGHRPGPIRATRRTAVFIVQCAHDAGDQRRGGSHRSGYDSRPAYRTELLSRPHLDDRGRGQTPWRCETDAGHAGRGLHPDRRTHHAVLSGQAAA